MHSIELILDALAARGFAMLDNALPEPLAVELYQVAKAYQDDFVSAGIGRNDDHQLKHDIRRDEISWIEGDTPPTQSFLQTMQALQDALNRDAFLGLRRFEAHYAHYPPGGFYKKHLDAFRGQRNRLVTIVYYLNQQWQPKDGGHLRLYDENNQHLQDIEPVFNRLLVFMSESFPHEVLPCHRDRYSIAGWFRTDFADDILNAAG